MRSSPVPRRAARRAPLQAAAPRATGRGAASPRAASHHEEVAVSPRVNRFNNLLVYFLITQSLFFVTPFFAAPPLEIPFDIGGALLLHSLAVLAVVGGYVLNALLHALFWGAPRAAMRVPARGLAPRGISGREAGDTARPRERWSFDPAFFTAGYALMVGGACIVILQVAIFRSPTEYLSSLLGGSYDINIRNAFLATHEEGGLSGVLKIFGAVPLSAYLFSLSLPHFLEMSDDDRARFARFNRVALIMTVVKVLFSLDRLTILAVVVANLFLTVRTRRNLRWKLVAVVVFLLLAEFVSRRRIEGQGVWGFVVLYYNLGIVNLQAMMNTLQGNTYGFGLLLSPLTFVLQIAGQDQNLPQATFNYEYVNAQYVVGYAYQDYSGLFWIFFAALGFLYKTLDRKVLAERNALWVSIYFLALSATITFVAVPGIKSVDFWLGVLVPLGLLKFFARRIPLQAPEAETAPAALERGPLRPLPQRARARRLRA